MAEESPASRLRNARLAANLTQSEAAELLGVTGKTISRWETGYPVKPKDVEAAERAYAKAAMSNGSLDKKVSRGTSVRETAPTYATDRNDRIADFEREMVRLGADDFEADTVRRAARDFLESIMSHGGTDPDAELDRFMQVSLRAWVEDHMKARKRREEE